MNLSWIRDSAYSADIGQNLLQFLLMGCVFVRMKQLYLY